MIGWSPLGDFGTYFALLETTLGSLWDPLGGLGLPRAKVLLLGVTLASLWLPWDAGGPLWGTFGSQGDLGMTLDQDGFLFLDVYSVCDVCA